MPDRLKAVLAGCGGISRAWLTPCKQREDIEIVGLVDISPDAAEAVRGEFELDSAVVGTDLGAVLAETRPDVVFNCAIPEAHCRITLQALEAGCHVLGEKPLAATMDEARQMVAAAESAGRVFAVIQNRRYQRSIRALREFLAGGELGPVTAVQSTFLIGAHFGGFRDRMEHVLLLDMAIHTFDAARFVIGADAESVYAYEWNPEGSWYDHDAAAVAVFRMKGGPVYTYQGSWCAEGLNTTWEADWRVICRNGSVTWDGADGFRAQKVKATGGFHSELEDVQVPLPDPGPRDNGHASNIDEFLACVRNGGTPLTAASDNIRSLAMVHGAIASAETGLPIAVTD
jgi:predicted dehydrogenase